jgi:hypothetical protein
MTTCPQRRLGNLTPPRRGSSRGVDRLGVCNGERATLAIEDFNLLAGPGVMDNAIHPVGHRAAHDQHGGPPLLARAGLTPPRHQLSAVRRRRSTTDQHLVARAAELGFSSLGDYLADRGTTRRRPSTSIASELGVHPGTVRDRLDQHGLPRQGSTMRPQWAIARQRTCWAAKRQARLASLGFADVEEYLRVRRVEQGWSLRRMPAELQVGSAWLKDQSSDWASPDQVCGLGVGRVVRLALEW